MDIGSSSFALLDALAFEGATKRNRPLVNVGDVVFAMVTTADKDIEPEIQCQSSRQKSDGFGLLTGGYIIDVSPKQVENLLNPQYSIHKTLKAKMPQAAYEIACGRNGRVWVKSDQPANTMIISAIFGIDDESSRVADVHTVC